MTLFQRIDDAHNQATWACAWGSIDGNFWNKYSRRFMSISGKKEDQLEIIVTGGHDAKLKIWTFRKRDGNKVKLKYDLRAHVFGIASLALSHSARVCATCSLDSSIMCWDVLKGCSLYEMAPGWSKAISLSFSPGDKYFITGSKSGYVHAYNFLTGKHQARYDNSGRSPYCISYSPNGSLIACGSGDGTLNLFNTVTGRQVYCTKAHRMAVRVLAFSPSLKYLITGSFDKEMRIFDVYRRCCIGAITDHNGAIFSIKFSSDGRRFVSGSSDRTVKLWNFRNRLCLQTFQCKNWVCGVSFSPDDTKILAVGEERLFDIFKLPTFQQRKTRTLNNL